MDPDQTPHSSDLGLHSLPLLLDTLSGSPLDLLAHQEHFVLMVSYCSQSMSVVCHASCGVRRAASTIALKAYSSYTPGPIDLILGRKHRGDL